MAETFIAQSAQLPVGAIQAQIQYARQHLVRMLTRKTFVNMLTGPFVTDKWAMDIKASGKSTTARGMPIVRCDDLNTGAGDQVALDILDRVAGSPVMGDNIAGDKASPVQFIRDSVYINQYRKVVSAGGRMSQQRTVHDMRDAAMDVSVDYHGDLIDNLCQVLMFGARGTATGTDWKIPLQSDPQFVSILTNALQPPLPNRYLGTTAAVTDPSLVSTTNVLTLNSYDDWRTILQTSQVPLAGVRLQDEKTGEFFEGENSPLLISFISELAWNGLMKDTSAQNWRTFLSNATERLSWTKHPLYRSLNCGLWNDVLICKAPRPISFNAGDTVTVSNADGSTSTVTAAVPINRGVIIGAQAMGMGYASAKRWPVKDGASSQGGGEVPSPAINLPYTWVEKLEDGDNLLKVFSGFIGGLKKLRYTFNLPTGPALYDNGVAAFDTYCPSLR